MGLAHLHCLYKEVISEIWRTKYAMSSLSHPDSIHYEPVGGPTLPLPSLRKIFKHYDEAKIQPSSNRPVSSFSKVRKSGATTAFSGPHKTVSRWQVQAAQALPVSPPQTEVCSFIEIDELCTFIAKKISVLARASGRLHLWQVLGFSYGTRTIKTVRSFGSSSSTCRRWAMVRTC